MVGDDWSWDIAPTAGLGMAAFWVADPAAVPPDPGVRLAGQGDLLAVRALLDATGDQTPSC